jgi:spore germination protein
MAYSTLAVFGTEEMKNLLWPTLELAKTASLPLVFIERLDPVFLAVWVTAVFTAIMASFYTAVRGLAHFFNFKNHYILTTLLVPIIYLLAMQPPNIVVLYRIVKQVGLTGLALTVGYPLVLLVLHFLKKRKKGQKGLVRTQ